MTTLPLYTSATSALPPEFAWRQSTVGRLLRCPESFRRYFLEGERPDHAATGFAKQKGTADHAGCELIAHAANEQRSPTREELEGVVLDVFAEAVADSQAEGEQHAPELVKPAIEQLRGPRLDRLVQLADDPRMRAVRWRGIEWEFAITEPSGRLWTGTVDLWGVATCDVPGFGQLGREPVDLHAGDVVVIDWKTGAPPPFGYVERTRSIQLGLYAMAVGEAHPELLEREWRTFLGVLTDLDRPKAPTDEDGKRIPKKLPKKLNPAFAEAVALALGETDPVRAELERLAELSHDAWAQRLDRLGRSSKRRPRDEAGDPIPKWLPEKPNPAWVEATSRPKGPVFREARVRYDLVLATLGHAVQQAELGIFPASGALTGQCSGGSGRRCEFASTCAPSLDLDQTN